MRTARPLCLLTVVLAAGALAHGQRDDRARPTDERTADKFSPLGFYDLLAYEQAYPGEPGSPLVRQASAEKYWAFQGIALRAGQPASTIWTSLGPLTTLTAGSESVSGRVSALAISPTCQIQGPCRLWAGTAGGGVWRTDDAMNTVDPGWRWVSRGLGTNSIGSLALDPTDRTGNTIFVGTGETNTPNNSGAGTGLYRSVDGGDRWTRVSTMIVDPAIGPAAIDFTFTRGIGAIVIDPQRPQTIYVGTCTAMLGMTAVRGGQAVTTGFPQPRVGLYKTDNGGVSWMLLWVPPLEPIIPFNPNLAVGAADTMSGVRDIKLDPRNSSTIYATAFNNAIHRSAPALEGGDAAFKPVFAIPGTQRFRDLAMFDLTVRSNRTRIYVYAGTESLNDQALYRLDNADVAARDLVGGQGTALVNTNAWLRVTSNDTAQPASTSRRLCSSQCFYDLVVATPPGEPDTIYVGGVAIPTFAEPTIRSTDAGASFAAFGSDGANPRHRAHVDVRAIVFHPRFRHIAFVGSDGGVVRSDGTFTDISGRCSQLFGNAAHCQTMLGHVPSRLYFLNRGLQTMQFYNIAVDPRDPLGRLIGGLQDNSTIWRDGAGDPQVWKTLFPFGDGTSASGFHPARSDVLFASFQSNRFFTNFRNGDQTRWVRTDDPIVTSGERETITASTGRQFITFDDVNPDTQFTAFQHVWRTQSNGGAQAFLEANCLFPGGSASAVCGDWVPLGVAYPFASGTTPDSTSRKPGDLTSDFYGSSRAGGLIVSAERTRADAGTLWAATSFGRLFVSKNADARGADVQFVRIDTADMPNRFVTRIVPDRADANVALISYSGFNALTPLTPGHVFRAVYDPQAQRATFTPLDFDLGDMPINTIAFDNVRGDLYAGTDFGPIVLRRGTTSWAIAGVGFPEALMVDLEIVPERRLLVAATHGLGIFYLNLPAAGAADATQNLLKTPAVTTTRVSRPVLLKSSKF
jgi:hypothetical protein